MRFFALSNMIITIYILGCYRTEKTSEIPQQTSQPIPIPQNVPGNNIRHYTQNLLKNFHNNINIYYITTVQLSS